MADDVEKWWTSTRLAGTYLGSHPSTPRRVEQLGLGFLSLGFLAIDIGDETVVAIGWSDIRSVTVETAESVESHVTITRLMLFGPLGLFAPKTTRTAYMTIESLDGDWIFAVDGLDAASLWAEVLPVSTRRPGVFRFGRPAAS